ncbi:hypothetical protein FNYG_14270 [Fusarium nygamai]|uniref:Uncharacterized protein n=1 Tax=Gibberella nygamai TaxID=42673 RepID=A0A2K0UT90_GIBNY|nr:hypothetical protein FNYG_14270 [Fusarium nygamai]
MAENGCPMCDPSGSIAGLIGPQFCAAGLGPAPSPSNPGASNSSPSLNPQAPEFQLPASSARDVSLPQSSEDAPGSGSDTRPPEETHASEEIQPPENRYASGDTRPPGEGHASEERDASQEIQSPRKRQASEDTGCPKERQSPSPPPHKITSRGGSNSPEPAHPVRGSVSSLAAAPTPDVVARPTVDREIHATGLDQNPPVSPKIQSEDPSHPSGQDQEKKPDQKPTPLYSDVVRGNTKETNQSSKKQDRPPAKSKKPSEDEDPDWPSGGNFPANSSPCSA